ncbi:hypothetical protein DFH09DRAFT_1355887 [Mycena vulgaris]|nr:hypothetical protein DFH09DRAFT_1355887 [Mycena vulgaris]
MGMTISNVFAGQILRLTGQLADKLENDQQYHDISSTRERIKQVYIFCSAIPRSPGWLDAISSAVTLARVDDGLGNLQEIIGEQFRPTTPVHDWVHAALSHVEQFPDNPDDLDYRDSALDGLLRALMFDRGAVAATPPKATLRVILWALSTPGTIAEIAFDLLCKAPAWFQDAELQRIGEMVVTLRVLPTGPCPFKYSPMGAGRS